MAHVTGMSKNERRVLQENLVTIQNNLTTSNVDKICDMLFAEGILDQPSLQKIRSTKSIYRFVYIGYTFNILQHMLFNR